jgi:formamidopyrimidine-DNA glycosylase
VPELPEVETIRAGLEPILAGRRLERVIIRDPRLTQPELPEAVAAALEGDLVSAVRRRGKYLIVDLESGRHLLVHLRMTGSFRHGRNGALEDDPYRRAVVSLDDGSDVAYRDVRRFGTWLLLEDSELPGYLEKRLGAEPLGPGFTAAALAKRIAGRRAPVKAVLLDQRVVAGMGNIYADEALWHAGIHPLTPAQELDPDRVTRLHRAIRRVLRAGVTRQGATLRDYRDPQGAAGSMQEEFRVYSREGKPCPRCRTPIEKTRVAGRGTWFCPACQKGPPA